MRHGWQWHDCALAFSRLGIPKTWHSRDRRGSMNGTAQVPNSCRTGRRRMDLEQRIRAIEDRLAIYNLIASHPPSADTGAQSYIRSIFADDAVLDLGGDKTATGNEAISGMSQRPAHQEAIRGGLAHFAGLPHVEIDGDRAVATSYLQILSPHPTAEPVAVPAH